MLLPFRDPSRRLALGTVIALLLSAGCASVATDPLADLVRQRTHVDIGSVGPRSAEDDAAVRRSVDDALGDTLTVDAAIRIALLDNPGLRAEYAQLGFATADLIAASRPANPGFSVAKLRDGAEREIDRTVTFDVIGLITAPIRYRVASRQVDATRFALAERAVRVAGETRKAWVRAVAAEQSLKYFEQARDAADAAGELARRMQQGGHWSRLTALREQAFQTDALDGVARSRAAAVATRERLARLLGIDDASRIGLPDRLPDLPTALRDTTDAERAALDERLDVRAARLRVDATARDLGLTRVTRLVNVLDLGYQNNTFSENGTGGPKQQGFQLAVEIPLFDFGAARSKRAEATYLEAAALLRQTAVDARSDVRTRVAAARDALEVARHYRTTVVPLRKAITDEMTLRYNGMLSSVFELLADARAQMNAVAATFDAERDYWLAEADLQFALTTGSTLAENAR